MKRFLALFLVLACLAPLAASAETEPVAAQPFYMFNWEAVEEGKYDNIYTAPFFWTAERVDYRISWDGASTPKDLAQKTYDLFKTRPAGTRFIKFGFPARVYLYGSLENYVYMDKGVDKLVPWFEEFLTEFQNLGGILDGVILDTEIVDMGSWYLSQDAKDDPLVYNTIVSDPRYETEIRPLLEERDFPFWENVTEYTPEIYSISNNLKNAENVEARAIWDRVMRNRVNSYLDQCVSQPLWKYFPDALVSDYQSADRASWYKFLSDTGDNSYGELTAGGGNSSKAGNTSNGNVYHSRPSESFYKESGNVVYKNPYSYTNAIYENSAFHMAMWEVNQFKNIYASTDNKKISAWLTSYNYGDKPLAYSAYTTEIIYHLGMLNPQPFLSYVVSSEVPDVSYDDRMKVLDQQLNELDRVAGYADRAPIEVPANWNDGYLLSGMYANGRNIWRITPDTTYVSLEAFQTEGKDPTFTVNGKTISFPGGTIIEDSKIDAVGSCGYWVETAQDVTPVVTADSDRFAKNPSLLLDFEDCQEGVFDYNTGNPIGAWSFKWNKSTGSGTNIVTQEGNKALAINGDVTLKSVLLPANITAGDAYAKNQAWEATITIPEGLSAESVIQLFAYEGKNQEVADGGFKIANGKLSYATGAENEEYEIIYEELTSIKPGTYTFKRVLDFSDPEAFLSDFYLLNAKGKVVASATGISCPAFSTITSINFVTEGVEQAMLLDDFKLSVTGKAADFTLYDAATGKQVTDPETPRAASTAYRLSWLNATADTEVGTLKAEIYQGDTLVDTKLVKELQMLPGCDGVDTGIVEVAEGQSVKLILETVTQPAAKNRNPWLVIIIAAVLAVGAEGYFIIKKKKKA